MQMYVLHPHKLPVETPHEIYQHIFAKKPLNCVMMSKSRLGDKFTRMRVSLYTIPAIY